MANKKVTLASCLLPIVFIVVAAFANTCLILSGSSPPTVTLRARACIAVAKVFPLVVLGRDNVESQENRRVELVFAPKDLELKGVPSKNINMKAGDCVLYNKERVELKVIPVACMDLHENGVVDQSLVLEL